MSQPIGTLPDVPRLSAFYGIVIYLYTREHGVAHVHARYGNDEAVVAIVDGRVLEGHLPRRQTRLVVEWTKLRRAELTAAWERAGRGDPAGTIEPLP